VLIGPAMHGSGARVKYTSHIGTMGRFFTWYAKLQVVVVGEVDHVSNQG
jgi:hypothetical protein